MNISFLYEQIEVFWIKGDLQLPYLKVCGADMT